MKDINFDELDKAVTSVLSSSKKNEPKEEPVTEATVKTEPKEAAVKNEAVVESPIQEQVPTERLATTPRRRGQFMDMVHPSSDMASKNNPVASPPIRRQGPRLAPLSPSIVEADADKNLDQTSVAEDQPKVAAGPTDTVETPITPPESKAVSPTEQLSDLEKVESEQLSHDDSANNTENTPHELSDEADLVKEDEVIEQPQPAESPFIESVDVEKRPLGSFAETKEPAEDLAAMIDPSDEIVIEETTSDEQLAADIVAIESDEPHTDDEGRGVVAAAAEEQPVGPSSIMPQYTSEPTSTDNTEYAVFDTQEYHQPLTPPEKPHKHRGLVYVLVALLMVGIGAAIGYAVFVLKLI